MAVRMKLVVPLTIPENPAEPLSRQGLGKRADDGDATTDCRLEEEGDPLSAAASINSTPRAETSSLFAVTTGLP